MAATANDCSNASGWTWWSRPTRTGTAATGRSPARRSMASTMELHSPSSCIAASPPLPRRSRRRPSTSGSTLSIRTLGGSIPKSRMSKRRGARPAGSCGRRQGRWPSLVLVRRDTLEGDAHRSRGSCRPRPGRRCGLQLALDGRVPPGVDPLLQLPVLHAVARLQTGSPRRESCPPAWPTPSPHPRGSRRGRDSPRARRWSSGSGARWSGRRSHTRERSGTIRYRATAASTDPGGAAVDHLTSPSS